jgi:hypothetical protein
MKLRKNILVELMFKQQGLIGVNKLELFFEQVKKKQ